METDSTTTAQIDSTLPYAIFAVGDQRFALSTEYVREMFLIPNVTPIPNTPEYVRGLINLRGKIVSLIDLRIYIDMPPLATESTSLIDELKARKQDHINWVDTLERCIRNEEPFTLATDPNLCAFGKWYKKFESSNASIQLELKKFKEPHERIHKIATQALAIAKEESKEAALALIDEKRKDDLKTLLNLFDQLITLITDREREMVVVYQHDEQITAFSVDEIISVERIPEDHIESGESVHKQQNMSLPGNIARREKTGDVLVIITPESINIDLEQSV